MREMGRWDQHQGAWTRSLCLQNEHPVMSRSRVNVRDAVRAVHSTQHVVRLQPNKLVCTPDETRTSTDAH